MGARARRLTEQNTLPYRCDNQMQSALYSMHYDIQCSRVACKRFTAAYRE